MDSTMASPSIITTFAGDGNLGLQVGHNSGAIHIAAAGKFTILPSSPCADHALHL